MRSAAAARRRRSRCGVAVRPRPLSRPRGYRSVRCRRAVDAEDERARGYAGSGGHQHVLYRWDLVDRCGANLPDAFGDAIHAVDVCLTELTAVRIDRQLAAELDAAVGNEVLRLTALAEPELLELGQHERREVVVDDGG